MWVKSPETRKMAWFSSATLEEKTAKEIRLFGFGNFFVERYTGKRLTNPSSQELVEELCESA
jgi:nucleoid DNA-binding protein